MQCTPKYKKNKPKKKLPIADQNCDNCKHNEKRICKVENKNIIIGKWCIEWEAE